MLRLVTVHYHATLGLQFPCALIDIQDNHVHTQVKRSLLCAKTGTQTGIEEHHEQGLVAAQLYIFETVTLYLKGLLQCLMQVTQILYTSKVSHICSVLASCLAVTADQPFVSCYLFKSHGAAGVHLLCAYAYLGSKSELGAVSECGRYVHIDAGGIDVLLELACMLSILRNDTFAVM